VEASPITPAGMGGQRAVRALREDLFAKSGRLLKTIRLGDVRPVEGRWVPMHALYRDVLKDGEGTEFVITRWISMPRLRTTCSPRRR